MNLSKNSLLATGLFVAGFLAVPRLAAAQGGIITTVAGNTVRGYTGDGGPATSATMNEPYGVAVDGAGNLYIADTVNQVIRKVTKSTGVISTIAGTGTAGYNGDNQPATSAQLNSPTTVTVDSAGNLYIADQLNDRIRRVATNGTITTVAGGSVVGFGGDNGPATSAKLCHPFGVTVDSAGNLYIGDAGNFRIRKVSGGTITTVAGSGTASGTTCNGQPGTFGGDNGQATSAKLNYPTVATVDSAGNIYIGDRLNHRIRKVATNGVITTVAGTGTAGYNGDNIQATTAQLNEPYMAALDGAGNLYIPDYFNYRIRKVATNGVITTVAGIGVSGWDGDGGPATSSYISDPIGVAVDSSNNFYIVDQASDRIRKVTPASPPVAPSVTANPSNQRVVAGSTASFSASASGSPAPTVQWQVSTNNGSSFANISGATSATYSLATSASDNGKLYRAVFTNSAGTATTTAGTLITYLARAARAPRNDLDGDNVGDFIVWRPSNGTWFWLTSSSGFNPAMAGVKQWGNQGVGDVPFVGDVDGDAIGDLILWRASTGTWFWLTSSSGYAYSASGNKQWGSQSTSDIPMVADLDGDGRVELIVWRPSSGTWFWLTSSSGYTLSASKQWGNQSSGDVPRVGDIDGDGIADLIVWRAPSGTWYWLTSSTGYNTAAAGSKQWGNQGLGDSPMVADVDGDGKSDLVVWRTSSGTWYWLTSSTSYNYSYSGFQQWGNQGAGDVPLLSDYDGDGKVDLTVWRAPSGMWFWLPSSTEYSPSLSRMKQWGAQGDIPIVK